MEETDVSIDDFYKYCQICGQNFGVHKKENLQCNLMQIVEKRKPRYYMMDLDNYTHEFLQKIVIWQDLKIQALTNPDKVLPSSLGLKEKVW